MFRNKASRSTQLTIKADDGTVDTITSTPGHKYYLPDNKKNCNANEKLEHASYEGLGEKWIFACDLKKGDRVLLSDGKYGIVIGVKTEDCEEFTTYNFEVQDFHTYYVGENSVLVHNANCDFKRLDEKAFMKDNKMSSQEFHQYKADLIKDSGINKNLFVKNPDIFVHKDAFQIAFKSTMQGGPKDLFVSDIFETFYKIRW